MEFESNHFFFVYLHRVFTGENTTFQHRNIATINNFFHQLLKLKSVWKHLPHQTAYPYMEIQAIYGNHKIILANYKLKNQKNYENKKSVFNATIPYNNRDGRVRRQIRRIDLGNFP